VSKKQFRADLFYRLNVIRICLPPSRERVQDVLPLTEFFVAKFSASFNKPIDLIPDEVIAVLKAYGWPGNIRELQNFIERAVLFSPGSVLRLPLELKQTVKQNCESAARTLADADRAYPGDMEANRLADRRAGRSGRSAWIAAYYADL
jgi:formate hydrogenlyase transcriptional activator